MKGYQVRGEGLCFQPGAQKSQFKLWRTTFDDLKKEKGDIEVVAIKVVLADLGLGRKKSDDN